MTPFLQTAGWALIHFVWQGAAIAAVIATALHLLARRSANARYIVACAGLVAMLAAPAVTARLMWTSGTSSVVATNGTESDVARLKGSRSSGLVESVAPAGALSDATTRANVGASSETLFGISLDRIDRKSVV